MNTQRSVAASPEIQRLFFQQLSFLTSIAGLKLHDYLRRKQSASARSYYFCGRREKISEKTREGMRRWRAEALTAAKKVLQQLPEDERAAAVAELIEVSKDRLQNRGFEK